MTTTKTKLLKVIREHCLNCCGGSYIDVKNCGAGPNVEPDSQCSLWAFRLGVDPEEPSDAMKEKGRQISIKQNLLKQIPAESKNVKIKIKTLRSRVAKKGKSAEKAALKV